MMNGKRRDFLLTKKKCIQTYFVSFYDYYFEFEKKQNILVDI